MLKSYLISIPLLILIHSKIGIVDELEAPNEAQWMGWFHAFLFHLLIYFLFVECFYHVERSVTLRILIELHVRRGPEYSLSSLQSIYSPKEMILERIKVLERSGFVNLNAGQVRLRWKGKLLANAMAFSTWLFQSEPPTQRS